MDPRRPDDSEAPTDAARSFFAPIDVEVLAAQQGVPAVVRFDELLGDFWPEEERVDEIIAQVRAWRREGTARPPP